MALPWNRRPDYGLDAPGLGRGLFLVGALAASLLAPTALAGWPGRPWSGVLGGLVAGVGIYTLGMGGFMVFESRVGKVRGRERLLDLLPWRGDERVLDVGCGRGLLAVAAARRVPSGRVVGIDLWRAEDQSANGPEGVVENARIEGVSERIEVRTADMRELPFPDGHFDAVVSAWAVHNVGDAPERARALVEMVRVLRPGGHLLISDIQHVREYSASLAGAGLDLVRTVRPPLRGRVAGTLAFGSFWPEAVAFAKPEVDD